MIDCVLVSHHAGRLQGYPSQRMMRTYNDVLLREQASKLEDHQLRVRQKC